MRDILPYWDYITGINKGKKMARKRIIRAIRESSSNKVKAYKLGGKSSETVVRLVALGAFTHREVGLRLE